MLDFEFLSRFDELSFRANLATQNNTGRTTARSRNNANQKVSSDWYEEMLRKIRESVEGVDDEENQAAGASADRAASDASGNGSIGRQESDDNSVTSRVRDQRTRINDVNTDKKVRNMSLSDYEGYVADKIASFRVSSTRAAGSQAIHISDDGLRAMQDDPEYEAWVLDNIERDLFAYDPWVQNGDTFKVDYYGAHKSDYHSWGNYGSMNDLGAKETFAQKAEGSIWSRGAGSADVKRSSETSGSNARVQERQRLEAERQKQQMMLEYYNAMRNNPFAAGTSSSIMDAYLAAAGRNDDASDAMLDYAIRSMDNDLF
ncbi:MAG: hypothetical protein IJQ21_00195 [Lachnospiraceae bacterium]|nr:hypothetical protein [Lachnospiraceae bacterium]